MTTSGEANTAGQPFTFVFTERVSTTSGPEPEPVDIVFKSPDGLFTDQTVTITNNALYFELIAEGVNSSGYLADGTTPHSFIVKSNRAWTAELANPAQASLFLSMTTVGAASETGVPFEFVFDTRMNTTATNADPKTITITFKSATGSFPDKTVTITNNAYYLTLEKYSHTTDTYPAHSFDVAITTNIPTNQLGSSIVNTSMITSASFVSEPSGLVLRVNVKTGSLTAEATGSVTVKWGSTIMRTLNITFPVLAETIRGMTVYKAGITVNNLDVQAGNYTCPPGSNLPRTSEQALLYLLNLHEYTNFYQDGHHITWYNANTAMYHLAYNTYSSWTFSASTLTANPFWEATFTARCVIEWNGNIKP
jgi:hypothetical protein